MTQSHSDYVLFTSTEASFDDAVQKFDVVTSQFSEDELSEVGIRQVNNQWQVWFKAKVQGEAHSEGR